MTRTGAWLLLAIVLLNGCATSPGPIDPVEFEAEVSAEVESARAFDARHRDWAYSGRLQDAVDELVDHAKAGGAARLFVVGNLLWELAPAQSLALHERAHRQLPDQPMIQYELALQYTRADECDRAIPQWNSLRKTIGIPASATYVAAYCFLVADDNRTALEIVGKSSVSRSHVAAEKMSYSVFGGPYDSERFDADYRRAAAGDRAALNAVLTRAFNWRTDWWNYAPNARAQRAAKELLADQFDAEAPFRREWDCMWPLLADGDASLTTEQLEACRLLIVPHPYPASSALGLLVVSRRDESIAAEAILAAHGATLRERAQSAGGDFEALRVLAYLQAQTRDSTGLEASDALGWERYRDPAFAMSRLAGAAPDAGTAPSEAYKALVAQALEDFPHVPDFVLLQIVLDHPGGDPPAADVNRLLRAETRTLDLSARASLRSHGQLRALYGRLAKLVGLPQ